MAWQLACLRILCIRLALCYPIRFPDPKPRGVFYPLFALVMLVLSVWILR